MLTKPESSPDATHRDRSEGIRHRWNIGLHQLKHGVPLKVVSERLGHSTPAFTMAVYQHVLPGMQREAADIFARLVTPAQAARRP